MSDILRDRFREALRDWLSRPGDVPAPRTLLYGYLAADAAAEFEASGRGADKIFLVPLGEPAGSIAVGPRTVLLTEPPAKVIAAFPTASFGRILLLWDPAVLADAGLRRMRELLKPGGRVGVLVAEEGSPPMLEAVMKEVRKGNPDLGVRLAERGIYPGGPSDLRRRLERAGFEMPRSWRGGFVVDFSGAPEVMAHLNEVGAGVLRADVRPEAAGRIESAVLRAIESRRGPDGRIRVEHRYLGAFATRPAPETSNFQHPTNNTPPTSNGQPR